MSASLTRKKHLSSAGHSRSDVDLDDPNFETIAYGEWLAYGRSKTANALFARELARRGGPRGLLSFSVHPGAIMTPLGRHLTEDLPRIVAEASERHPGVTVRLEPSFGADPALGAVLAAQVARAVDDA